MNEILLTCAILTSCLVGWYLIGLLSFILIIWVEFRVFDGNGVIDTSILGLSFLGPILIIVFLFLFVSRINENKIVIYIFKSKKTTNKTD